MDFDYEDLSKLQMLEDELHTPLRLQDEKLIRNLIYHLIKIGFYTSTKYMIENSYSMYDMVRQHGPYWFDWSNKVVECEMCKCDLRDREKGPPFTKAKYMKGVGDHYGLMLCDSCYSLVEYW